MEGVPRSSPGVPVEQTEAGNPSVGRTIFLILKFMLILHTASWDVRATS